MNEVIIYEMSDEMAWDAFMYAHSSTTLTLNHAIVYAIVLNARKKG